MIKKKYLSEVEAIYTQGETLFSVEPPRLFVVWAEVGRDVHGFVAAVQCLQGDVVKFKPVTDITILKYSVTTAEDQKFVNDPRTRSPQDLLWKIVGASPWRDEDEICKEEPDIGEDVILSMKPRWLNGTCSPNLLVP